MSGNGFDSKQLTGYLSEIDIADDEIDKLREDFSCECEPHRERIKDILGAVKDAGINMKAFRAVLAEHRGERRHVKRVNKLDMMDRADYEAMMDALGILVDTPLGEAALKSAIGRTLKAGESVSVEGTERVEDRA